VGGFVQFYKMRPQDGRYHPIMMKASEAFKLLEEVNDA